MPPCPGLLSIDAPRAQTVTAVTTPLLETLKTPNARNIVIEGDITLDLLMPQVNIQNLESLKILKGRMSNILPGHLVDITDCVKKAYERLNGSDVVIEMRGFVAAEMARAAANDVMARSQIITLFKTSPAMYQIGRHLDEETLENLSRLTPAACMERFTGITKMRAGVISSYIKSNIAHEVKEEMETSGNTTSTFTVDGKTYYMYGM